MSPLIIICSHFNTKFVFYHFVDDFSCVLIGIIIIIVSDIIALNIKAFIELSHTNYCEKLYNKLFYEFIICFDYLILKLYSSLFLRINNNRIL
jgi:hypothetical protein